jgi:predicted  nucleic acid-binding Zn-ribbon protein
MALTNDDLKAIKGIVQEETTKIVRNEIRKVVNAQSALKSELLAEIKKVNKKADDLETEMRKGFKGVDVKLEKLIKRVDIIGLQIARLEDDAPTVEEFNALEKRVFDLERKVVQVSPMV